MLNLDFQNPNFIKVENYPFNISYWIKEKPKKLIRLEQVRILIEKHQLEYHCKIDGTKRNFYALNKNSIKNNDCKRI